MIPGDPYNPMYWQTLITELTQCIPPAPLANPLTEDKLVDTVARHNLKTYSGSYLMELEEWIRRMEKIFPVIEVPEEKKVTIGTFYFTRVVDI